MSVQVREIVLERVARLRARISHFELRIALRDEPSTETCGHFFHGARDQVVELDPVNLPLPRLCLNSNFQFQSVSGADTRYASDTRIPIIKAIVVPLAACNY